MRIEFDPTNPTEAAAVRAMLTALSGEHKYPTHAEIERFLPSDEPEELDRVVAVSAETSDGHSAGFFLDVAADPNAPTQTLNAEGEPHDPRIHSTPPKLNADGTWRAKRGVTADQIAAVRAEREAAPVALAEETAEDHIAEVAAAFEEPVTAPPAPPVTAAPPAPTGQSEAPLAPVAIEKPPAETAPIPPSAPVVPSSPSFLDVMKAITAAQKDGKIDTAKVKEMCAAVGAGESTMGLNGPDNGDKRGAFMALLGEVVS